MNRKLLSKIIIGLVVTAGCISFAVSVFVKPWIEHKIQAALNNHNKACTIRIEKFDISILSSSIELGNITLSETHLPGADRQIHGKIASIKLSGINVIKFLIKKDISIHTVVILDISVTEKIFSLPKYPPPTVAMSDITIGNILVDKLDLLIAYDSCPKTFSIKDGVINISGLQIKKQESITKSIARRYNFKAKELNSISADSMYTYTAREIVYSGALRTLSAISLSVHPNYPEYDFTSRHEFQTDRIEAWFRNISVENFPAEEYFKSGNLTSSYVGIGNMEMKVFRDKRKKFRHSIKPTIRELLISFPGKFQVDSAGLLNGNITYSEHAEKADKAGRISFNNIHMKTFNISNDTIFKTKSNDLSIHVNALLMGKGRISVVLTSGISDRNQTFSMQGSLSGMAGEALNPLLENSAFMHVTSGEIDSMKFFFIADDLKSSGKLNLLYHGLKIAVIDKSSGDTATISAKLISLFANSKILDANPGQGKQAREGIIRYERDPERFLFGYCFKSILTGIKSSIVRRPRNKKNQ